MHMANAGTILSRGKTCPLSCHRPSEQLPRLSCVCRMAAASQKSSAPHREQLTESECLWREGTHASQKTLNQLFGGKASWGRQRREPGTRMSLSAGSTPPSAGEREQLAKRFRLGLAPGSLSSPRGTSCVCAGEHFA